MRNRDVLDLYMQLPLWVKFHTRVRWWTSPFDKIAGMAPQDGKVLELGCGYGLMANLLSLRSPGCDVLGVDMSTEKINRARESIGSRSNIHFEIGDIHTLPAHSKTFRCILILDVLYLLPFDQWAHVLTWCADALEPGGLLLLKEQDTRPRRKYVWNLFQEWLAVRVLGITKGAAFTFPGQQAIREILSSAGFSVDIVRLDKGYCYPHILFLCRTP